MIYIFRIIPFVAADALDKPKDATLEHREDTISATETDILLEPSAPQSGQFSPPAKTEGNICTTSLKYQLLSRKLFPNLEF